MSALHPLTDSLETGAEGSERANSARKADLPARQQMTQSGQGQFEICFRFAPKSCRLANGERVPETDNCSLRLIADVLWTVHTRTDIVLHERRLPDFRRDLTIVVDARTEHGVWPLHQIQ